MKDLQFEEEEEAFRFIVVRLGETLPVSLARAIARQFVVHCCEDADLGGWPRVPTNDRPCEIGAPFFGPWTVREQELRDLKELAAAIAAIMLRPTAESAICALTLSAACMAWRLRRNGVSVNPLQRTVLLALRCNGPLSVESLVRRASSTAIVWTTSEIEETLRELGAIRLNNGTVVALVHQAADGQWSTDARGLWEVPFGAYG